VEVSWNDAKEFCRWLTKRERSAGDLPEGREYRLPKDEEWSAAVGLKNEVGSTPEEKSGKNKLYPWDIPQKRDKSWPPPVGAGNYLFSMSITFIASIDSIAGADERLWLKPL
jgi:formylglycine-generating enzyme required for sulfatase activity